jgi:hypothetical protein
VVGQTGFEIVTQLERIGPALKEHVARKLDGSRVSLPCPIHLEKTLTLGQKLWERLDAIGSPRPAEVVAGVIVELFAARSSGRGPGDSAQP